MLNLKTFKLSNNKSRDNNIYPFNVLKNKEPDVFLFDNITVLYGNNGSGKSTEYKVQKWSELENVRYFYEFFESRRSHFERSK